MNAALPESIFESGLGDQWHWHADEKCRSLTMWVPCKLRTVNAERAGNTWEHRRYTAEVRETFGWAARATQFAAFRDPVRLVVRPVQSRGPLGDVGAHYPTVKAAVDGLVDAELLAGDGPDVVVALLMHAPRKGGKHTGLILTAEVAR